MRALRCSLVFLLLLGPLAAATSARPDSVPRLAGRTTLIGEGASWTDVHVPDGATIDVILHPFHPTRPSDGVRLEGSGPFVGLVMWAEGGSAPYPTLIAGRFTDCDSCAHPPFNFMSPREGSTDFESGERTPRFVKIPEGTYRAYLISDGGEVRAQLRIAGLTGSTTIRTSSPAAVDAQRLPARLDTESGDSLFSAGSTFRSGFRGLLVANLFIKGHGIENVHWGICGYAGLEPPPDEISYGPHCTVLARDGHLGAGYSGSFASLDKYSTKGYFFAQLATSYSENSFPPNLNGNQGLGAWHLTPSSVEAAGAQAVFLELPTEA